MRWIYDIIPDSIKSALKRRILAKSKRVIPSSAHIFMEIPDGFCGAECGRYDQDRDRTTQQSIPGYRSIPTPISYGPGWVESALGLIQRELFLAHNSL